MESVTGAGQGRWGERRGRYRVKEERKICRKGVGENGGERWGERGRDIWGRGRS